MRIFISKEIEKGLKRGNFYFLDDFKTMGGYDAIKSTFIRLANNGTLKRLAKGIYYYPKTDPEIGELLPSLDEIAYAVAENEKVNIRPAPEYAIHQIGLSTQVPMNPVFQTDGRSKKIHIDNHTIIFKAVSPKKLATRGKISSTVIQAMEAKGLRNLTQGDITKIKNILLQEKPKLLLHDIKVAPIWIANILHQFLKENADTT